MYMYVVSFYMVTSSAWSNLIRVSGRLDTQKYATVYYKGFMRMEHATTVFAEIQLTEILESTTHATTT